ncbi:MAG: tetratricopeptide repeat protein, partial [Anaerolineales bacterium]
ALLRRLSVFAGGWTLAAAETVCADRGVEVGPIATALPVEAVLEALGHLAAKSLMISAPAAGVEARFHMLETIREFAHGKLEESGEAVGVRQRHLEFFLDLAERAEPELRGREQMMWFEQVEAEHDNFRRALEWAVHSGELAAGLRLASALHYFWVVRNYSNEAYSWFNRLLAGNRTPTPSAESALALARAALFALYNGDLTNGTALCQASLALARELSVAGQASTGYALRALSWIRAQQHAPSHEITALRQQSLALFEQARDDWGRAMMLTDIGIAAQVSGDSDDYGRAAGAFDQSQSLFERLGDLSGLVRALNGQGELLVFRNGECERACELYEAARSHSRLLRDWEGYANASGGLVYASQRLGRFEQAWAAADDCIALVRGSGHLESVPELLKTEAVIAYNCGRYAQAAALLDESRKLETELGTGQIDFVPSLEIPLADLVRAQGDPARAISVLEKVLPVLRAGGHNWWMAGAQQALGEARRDQGEYESASLHFEASLAWFRERDRWLEVTSLTVRLGGVARRQGDSQQAASLLRESLRRCQAKGLRPLMAACLSELAYLASMHAQMDGGLPDAERAARLLGAHEALCRAMGLPIPPADQAERAEYDRAVETLRRLLGANRLDAAWYEGKTLGAGPAADFALEDDAS